MIYKVTWSKTYYRSGTKIIEASSHREAQQIADDNIGNWEGGMEYDADKNEITTEVSKEHLPKDWVDEFCTLCDNQAVLENRFEKQTCNHCGNKIKPCSICQPLIDNVPNCCNNCPLEEVSIDEYECYDCGQVFSEIKIIMIGETNLEEEVCPHCQSKNWKELEMKEYSI